MSYAESQACILEAESLASQGFLSASKHSYLKAAHLQHEYVSSLGENKPRTRAILGLSAATLYFRAGMYYDAECVIVEVENDADKSDGRTFEKLMELEQRCKEQRKIQEART